MKISDVIKTLEELKESQGDQELFVTACGSVKLLRIESIDNSLVYPGIIVIDTKGI